MAEDDQKPKKGGKLKLILIIIIVVGLAVGLSVAGTLYFLGGGGKADGADEASQPQEKKEHVKASYYVMERPLIVSIGGDRQRYAQIDIAFVMREHDVSSALDRHKPTVRSRLQHILQKQAYADLHSTERKEALAELLLSTVNEVLAAEGAEPVEKVLFTNFVMQ